jgi:hypothetical protein
MARRGRKASATYDISYRNVFEKEGWQMGENIRLTEMVRASG